jgi:hypothetical protein
MTALALVKLSLSPHFLLNANAALSCVEQIAKLVPVLTDRKLFYVVTLCYCDQIEANVLY